MKIGILQLNPIVGDLEGNIRKILNSATLAFKEGARLCITPELSLTGYPPRDWLLYPQHIEFCQKGLLTLSKKIPDRCGLIVGLPQKNNKIPGKPLFNTACLVTKNGIQKAYSKKLLPTYDIFDEDRYFEPGNESGFFEFEGYKFFLTICEDAWFEPKIDGLPRYLKNPLDDLKPCDLLINISASPFYVGKQKVREALFQNIVSKHKIPFLFVNQTGANDDLIFDGQSCFLNGEGHTLTRLTAFKEETKIIDLEGNYKKDTPNFLEPEEEIIKALCCGIQDFVRKLNFKSVLIGLSGGIDSALTAVIACKALGSKNVTGILMPSPYSSKGSVTDSVQLAKNLKMRTHTVPISAIMKTYEKVFNTSLHQNLKGLPEENLQSRMRGNILMTLSKQWNSLVLTTGNKSELATGYCTIYGDMAGALGVLGDVYKTMIYRISYWYNKNIKNVIPQEILVKAPSAELKPNQKDQDTLPPYDLLDAILERLIERKRTGNQIIQEGFNKITVRKVEKLFHQAEFKRKQSPPILKITDKAFGTGWRMPIAAKN